MASLMGKVAGAMVARIAADVHRYRATPPAIANTDGDSMCLITAAIAVEEGTAGKLAARPDFDRDSDEPDRGTWWGALIPDGQREAMVAEAMAQLRAQGHQDVEAPAGLQRWVLGVRCCGSSSTRPASWPLMARPASTPPGCASNSTCQAISPTERPGQPVGARNGVLAVTASTRRSLGPHRWDIQLALLPGRR